MLGSFWRSTGVILLLGLACIQGSSVQLNLNNVCALIYDGFIAAYNACDTYYKCQGGIAHQKQCSSGYYFDKESQTCLPQGQVQCVSPTSTPCSGYRIGSWAPVAGSCTDFYYCGLNGPERSSCPQGECFNPITQACVYASQYICTEKSANSDKTTGNNGGSSGENSSLTINIQLPVNLCKFFRNDRFFGNPSSCDGWNKCSNGVMESGLCPIGFLYNVLKMECDYPAQVSCSQVTNNPYLSATTCSTKNTKKRGGTCDTYFVCDGAYFQLQKCPSGLFYDTVSQTCVDRLEARNNCDRCLGSTRKFVNAYSATNCTGYLYCRNGMEVSSGFCEGGTYFDESYGGCVASISEPLYGCCNPAYYNVST